MRYSVPHHYVDERVWARWAGDELMPKTLATATVDRLLHHAHVCVTEGESFRLAQATAGNGATALPN
jgi:hypothetical protein